MHKALIPFLTLATIVPLLLAPPTSRADAAAVAPPADDETLIYVIREGRMLGAPVELISQAVTNRIREREEMVIDFLRLAIERANSGTADFTLLGSDAAY